MSFFGIPPVRLRWHKHPDDAGVEYEDFSLGVEGMELHRRSFTRQVETGHEARLRIENRNGRISVRTHDQPNVVIDVVAEIYAASSGEADAEAERMQRAIVSEGNRVDIVTPEQQRPEFGIFFFGRGPKVDYDIRVPAETEIQASSRNGPVQLVGTRKPAQIQSHNGRVTAEDIAAEVTVESHNGRISVTRCAGPVRVRGANGPITLEKPEREASIQTRNGSIEITEPAAGVTATSTNGSIRFVGRVRGDVDLRATNGGIRMAVTADSRFEIDAESHRGSVQSDLPVRQGPPAEATTPAYKVYLRTTNGGIRLTER